MIIIWGGGDDTAFLYIKLSTAWIAEVSPIEGPEKCDHCAWCLNLCDDFISPCIMCLKMLYSHIWGSKIILYRLLYNIM